MKHKPLAILLVIIFIPIIILFLGILNLKLTLFTANFYKNIFEQNQIYQKIAQNLPEILLKSIPKESPESPLFTAQQLSQISQNILTEAYLKENLQKVFDAMPAVSKGQIPDIQFSLVSLKQNLQTQINTTLEQQFNSLPICSQKQLQVKEKALDCRPAGTTYQDLQKTMGEESPTNLLSKIPDTYNLKDLFSKNQIAKQIVLAFKVLQTLLWILAILVGLILFALIYWAKKSAKAMALWVGLALFIPSVIIVIGNFISQTFTSSSLFRQLIPTADPTLIKIQQDLIFPIATGVASGVMMSLRNIALWILIFSFILIIVSFILPKRTESIPQ